MDVAMLIAKVLGVYFLISGIFIVTQQRTLATVLRDLFQHRALTYIIGALLVMGGALIVFQSNLSEDWVGTFVKVMGWAILIKGALYILAPQKLHAMVRPWSRSTLLLLGLTTAAVGGYLVFFLS